MKKIFLAISVLLLSLTISGCVCHPDNTSAKGSEIVMWLVGSESQAKVIQKLGDQFFEDSGMTFRCESISWSGAHSKYLTSIAAGVTPDIGTMGLTWGTEFGTLGAMVDLAVLYPEDVKIIKQETFPGIWEACQYKEHVYGIPLDLTEHILYYRNDMIRHPPLNWEGLVALLEELKLENKGMILDWGNLEWIGFSPFLWQAGGDYYNQEGTTSTLDSEAASEAMKFFSELYTKYGVPKTSIPVEQGMRTGDFPLAISGNWKIDMLKLSAPEITGKWSVGLLPLGPSGKRTTFLGGRIIGVFNQSKNKEDAWSFVKHLFEPEIQLKIYEGAVAAQDTYLPPNVNSWDELPMDIRIKRILKAQALDAKGPPSVLGWDESTRFIDQAIQRVVLEGASPKEEITRAKQLLDQHIITP